MDAPPPGPHRRSKLSAMLGYGVMIAGTVALFFVIRHSGNALLAPAAAKTETGAITVSAAPDVLLHLLVALTAVIVTGQILAKLFSYVGQASVIGEVVAGIVLGPSLLGTHISGMILPPSVAPYLGVVAQLGVILYMFLVGLELDLKLLGERAHTTVVTSHASILVPFILGAALALGLYPRLSSSDVPFTSFALFLGAAMAITAFPVLARTLTDHNMARTPLGVLALSCAATDDVTAWCLLAFVVGVAKAELGTAVMVIMGAVAFIVFMVLVMRPLLKWAMRDWTIERMSRGTIALAILALLLSALTTEAIGIHAIFGAFLLGAIIPHDSALARTLPRQLEDIVAILFLPAFFALTGMRTRIDLVAGVGPWLICGLITLVATAGKFGGTLAAARLTGLSWRDATILGTLMNTRGLMELIILNIGLDLKIISPTLFAMMVIMALVTTMATSPVLRLLKPPTNEREELKAPS